MKSENRFELLTGSLEPFAVEVFGNDYLTRLRAYMEERDLRLESLRNNGEIASAGQLPPDVMVQLMQKYDLCLPNSPIEPE